MNDSLPGAESATPATGAQDEQLQEEQFDELEQLDKLLVDMEADDEGSVSLRTLTRLLIGGVLIGREELLARLQQWEQDSRRVRPRQETAQRIPNRTVVIDADLAANTTLPITPPPTDPRTEPVRRAGGPPPQPAATSNELGHVLIGLLFETQSRMAKRRKAILNVAGQSTDALMSPVLQKMDDSGLLGPARNRFEKLVARGEAVTARWAQRGRIEEAHSRRLTATASQEVFNSSMNELGQAPALQDLIRKQSAGLGQEALDEARVRTVGGDVLAEQLARRLLKRAPRITLPKPAFLEEHSRPPESKS